MGAVPSTITPHNLDTPRGTLQGIQFTNDALSKKIYTRYTKIPYALPPVGPLRWRRPQSLPNDFSFNAADGTPGNYSEFGPVCPQPVYAMADAMVPPSSEDSLPAGMMAKPIVNVQSEDCLYVNIWVPEGKPPPEGWPVQFFIHGGWLQMGDPMQSLPYDPLALLANSTPRIIIAPGYRLSLFGFLCAPELSTLHEDPAPGNYGFWDQRMALEWTSRNISLFGGNPSNISVGGLSAGAYSAFFQLYHDTFLPESSRLIKRAYLWSNAIGIQPNYPDSPTQTKQFADLLAHFSIPAYASPSAKLSALRAIPSQDLIAALAHLPLHTFRATTDSSFIPPSFLTSIHSGALAAQLKKNGTSIMLGECSDEGLLYRLINPPSSLDTLRTQLENYYPPPVVSALLSIYPHPDPSAPAVAWQDLYGRITGDCQVHCTLRGLVHCLLSPPNSEDAMPIGKVLRYKICWRAKALDRILKPELGVCHGADTPIWWASGFRAGFTAEDGEKTKSWIEPFGKFLNGEDVGGVWGTKGERDRREMGTDGVARVLEDEESWEWGMRIWSAMWDAQQREGESRAKI